MRIGFAVLAIAVLSGVAWLSFKQEDAAVGPKPTAVPAAPAVPEPAPASVPSTRVSANELPAPIPYDKLTTVSKNENRIIYTTSNLGEPMEVHPDGLVVIHNHRQVIRYANGREEVKFVTLRARPKLVSPPVLVDDSEKPTDPK
jgi:hypothetical protein